MTEEIIRKKGLIQIYIDPKGKSIQEIFNDYDYIISKEICTRIFNAIDSYLDKIIIAQIVTPMEIISITATKDRYQDTLEKNMKKMIEFEEFEICSDIVKYINKLKEDEQNEKTIDSFFSNISDLTNISKSKS